MENINTVPPQEHIDYLIANPETADRFDSLHGEGASLKYLPATPVVEEKKDEPKGYIQDIADQSVAGVKLALKETLETLEGISDFAEEKIPLGGLKLGGDASNGIIEYVPPSEFKQEEGEGLFETVAENIKPVENTPAETIAGQIVRPISQFTTGFVSGGVILKPIKWYNKLNGYAKAMIKGGLSDFTVFDEHEARLTDFLETYYPDTADHWITYLSADDDDGFFEGKMKNAIEGAMIGTVAESVFRMAKFTKNLKVFRNKDDLKGANELIKKQEKVMSKLDDVTEEEFQLFNKASNGIPVQLRAPASPPSKVKLKEIVNEADYIKQAKENLNKVRMGEMSFAEASDVPINFVRAKDGAKANIESMEDVMLVTKAIYDNIETVNTKMNKVVTQDESLAGARKIVESGTLQTLYKGERLVREMAEGDATIPALEFVYNGLARATIDASKKLKLGKVTEKEVDNLFELTAKTQELFKLSGTLPARMMNIRNTFLNQQPKAIKDLDVLIEQSRFRPDAKTKKAIYDKMAKSDDENAVFSLGKAIKEIATLQNRGIDKINEFWINMILSNPKTHGINMTSNIITTVVRPIEQLLGAMWIRDKQAMMEAVGTVAGLFKYFGDARSYFRVALRRGDSVLTTGINKVDLPNNALGEGSIAKGVRLPTRFLTAEDEFFKQWNYRSKLYGIAFSEALSKGLSRKKNIVLPSGKKTSEFQQYVDDYFDDAFTPSLEGTNPRALDYAKENTFTKELGDDTLGGKYQSLVNAVPIMRQITPFVRTPVNLARFVWDRSPVFKKRKQFVEELKSTDPSVRAQAKGKQLMGLALFSGAISLAWNDMITGGYPKDKYLRRQLMDAGWQPYSFKIGGKYYSYERLDPYGAFFGLIADFGQLADDLTEDERQSLDEVNKMALYNTMDTSDKFEMITGAGLKVAQHFTNKTYLKGISDIIALLESDEPNKAMQWLKGKVGSLVPSVATNMLNDEIYREARSITDTIKTRTWLYEGVDPSFNVLGEIRTRQNGFWERFLLPTSVSKQGGDILADEFVRLDQRFTPLQNKVDKLELNKFTNKDGVNAWRRWNELTSTVKVNGLTLREKLERDIQSDFYKNKLTDNPLSEDTNYRGSRVEYINKVINAYKKKAKQQLYREKFTSENGLTLLDGMKNNKINKRKAKRGLDLLPLE